MQKWTFQQGSTIFPYYTYRLFQSYANVICLVSTRQGGQSAGSFSSCNLSLGVGDLEKVVLANRETFFQVAGVRPQAVARAHMNHGNTIAVVTPANSGHPFWDTDGLVTRQAGIALFLTIADCAAVAFFDPQQHVVALLHAGWRGIVNGIIPKMIHTMVDAYGCHPHDLLVGVSPCIGPCCYQVQQDLVAQFMAVFPSTDLFFPASQDEVRRLDLWAAIAWQLRQEKILSHHIEIARLCTACRTDEFYSYRAERSTGRFGCLVMLAS